MAEAATQGADLLISSNTVLSNRSTTLKPSGATWGSVSQDHFDQRQQLSHSLTLFTVSTISLLLPILPNYLKSSGKMFKSWFHSLCAIVNVTCWNTWGNIDANSLSSAALCLLMRFCSFDAMQSSWPGEKSNVESHDIWSEACKTEKEYVQRVVHLWNLLPWALWGLLLDELISRCVFRPWLM